MVLNRGNHEDYAVCCAYGFQTECVDKYDQVTFGMFVELFQYLPLFTIINKAVLVLHGGLFHDNNVTLEELNKIERFNFSLSDFHFSEENKEGVEALSSATDAVMHYKQLQRDALWSDPSVLLGNQPNTRGAGVLFGPDVTQQFLNRNHLKMVVRSHECVPSGFDQPFPDPYKGILCTIFSASNYGGAGNSGAYMKFIGVKTYGSFAVPDTDLYYTVHYYDYVPTVSRPEELTSSVTIKELILRKRPALLLAFEAADVQRSGSVSKSVWCDVLYKVTQVKLHWLALIPILVPTAAIVNDSVEYMPFLSSLSRQSTLMGTTELIDSLYKHHQKLESVFYFFDCQGTGRIAKPDFREGCSILNKTLPAERQVTAIDEIFDLMDMDQSQGIDLNEFFEIFRMTVLCRQQQHQQGLDDSSHGSVSSGGTSDTSASSWLMSSVKVDNEMRPSTALAQQNAVLPDL